MPDIHSVKENRIKEFQKYIETYPELVPTALSYCNACGVCCLRINCKAMSIEQKKDIWDIKCSIYDRDGNKSFN
jgi:hypothetical protein